MAIPRQGNTRLCQREKWGGVAGVGAKRSPQLRYVKATPLGARLRLDSSHPKSRVDAPLGAPVKVRGTGGPGTGYGGGFPATDVADRRSSRRARLSRIRKPRDDTGLDEAAPDPKVSCPERRLARSPCTWRDKVTSRDAASRRQFSGNSLRTDHRRGRICGRDAHASDAELSLKRHRRALRHLFTVAELSGMTRVLVARECRRKARPCCHVETSPI